MSSQDAIQGIHHITLVCGNAQRTVDFYTQVLGLRFVKRHPCAPLPSPNGILRR